MKTRTLKTLFKLSFTQKILVTVIGLIWLLLVSAYEIRTQYEHQKEVFHEHIDEFTQAETLDQQRSETILNALTEYYTSQAIKSNSDFRHFAQGLLNKNIPDYGIGLAELVARNKQKQIEANLHELGFESFHISNSGLFREQQANDKLGFLTITNIAPLDPKHSVYLSEDLFSIPKIVTKFTHALRNNKPQVILLTNNKTQQLQKLIFTPVYLNSPDTLNIKQRLHQVRGIVFILQPVQATLKQQAAKFFNPENTTIIVTHHDNKTIIQNADLKTNNFLDHWLQLKNSAQFIFSGYNAKDTIEVQSLWHLSEVNKIELFKALLINFFLFLLSISLILTLSRYTTSLLITQTRLLQILETSQDAVIITDENGYILDWNPESVSLFHHTKDQAIGNCIIQLIFDTPDDLTASNSQSKYIDYFYRTLQLYGNGPSHKVEVTLVDRDKNKITAEIATSILKVQNKTEISLFIKDITYQRQTEDAMTQMAFFDPLTQLENRTFFKRKVNELINTDPNGHFAILFLDLDGFKQVNDTLGHNIGDELLKVVAKRIQNTLRSNNDESHICRFGGDEFVVLLKNSKEKTGSQISLRLLNQIERIIKIEDDELQVSTSIGVALYPQHGKDIDTLLRHADTAMYQSKSVGKNTYSIYHDAMEESVAERSLLEKHLRKAIEHDEFHLVYQPQMNLQTGNIIGVEALIRWNNPVLGFVPPDKFIPIAEESHLILTIGEWVTKTCIAQLEAWKGTEFDSLHIAMNVSSVQFENPYFIGFVRKLMETAGVHNHLLEIELTERTVMNNVNENISRFNQIRSSGFGLSVDDFGTGYSSLSYLKKFPLSILKIDKSFIDGIPQDDEDIIITSAILNLAHSLSMQVVAEGVETEEQLDYLTKAKCNFAQGYLISRPLTINDLEDWLNDNHLNFYSNHNLLLFKEDDA
ncbi:hypothetical protein JCM30760_04990 [Thiomicrorhabdus hydrogeniphila]